MERRAKGSRVEEYVSIRVIATLLVLIGHATKIYTTTKLGPNPAFTYGGMAAFLEQVRLVIYSFHMPLFFMLSGAVFVISIRKRPAAKEWLAKRFRRLMIPYVLVMVLFLIPVRLIAGYYQAYQEPVWKTILFDYILAWDVNYLWFILALMEISCLIILLLPMLLGKDVKRRYLALLPLLLLSVAQFQIGELPFQLSSAIRYLLWFYLGACFELDRDKISRLFSCRTTVCLAIVWIAAYCGHTYMEKLLAAGMAAPGAAIVKLIKMGVRYVMEGCGSLMVFSLAFSMKWPDGRLKRRIDRQSFGIYLYHCPILYLVQLVYARILNGADVSNALFLTLDVLQIVLILGLSMAMDQGIGWIRNKAASMVSTKG